MSKFNKDKENLKHPFYGRGQDQIKELVAGSDVYVCNECIELCSRIVEEELVRATSEELTELPAPKKIIDRLNEYVIDQKKAEKSLTVAIYNHYKRIQQLDPSEDDVELQRDNIALIGLAGSSKTLLTQALAKTLNVPFTIADATSLTGAGYASNDVENILLCLIQAADFDIDKAEKGIIYIDEIDRITRKSENTSIMRDVSGEGVQQALLKILKGAAISVSPQGGRKHPNQELIQIDTTDILFILGDTFNGTDEVIRRRLGEKVIGSANNKAGKYDEEALLTRIHPEDLQAYGLIPEFIGRVPIVANLETLDIKALKNILTQPKNTLVKQCTKILALGNTELESTGEASATVNGEATERKAGARGLQSIIEKSLIDIMHDVPSTGDVTKVVVTTQTVNEEIEPEVYGSKGDLLNGTRTSV